MTQTKFSARALLSLTGFVATLIMLTNISVAQTRFFLGVGYAPGSGMNTTIFKYDSTTISGNTTTVLTRQDTREIESATGDLEIVLGVRRIFAEQGIEADFALHRNETTETDEQTTTITATGTATAGDLSSVSAGNSIDKYDISASGATNGLSLHARSIRTEGLHAQGGLEYRAGSTAIEKKHTSYVSTLDGVTTVGSIKAGEKFSTDLSQLVLSFGPVFVSAGSSWQHGLLFSGIVEDFKIDYPPVGSQTNTIKAEQELKANVISYTFRTLGEGRAYFGQIGYGSTEYASVESNTGNTDASNDTTVEFKGDGSLFLLTAGVLMNDAHEITLGVRNSTLVVSQYTYTQGTAPLDLNSLKREEETSRVLLAYSFLF